VLRSMRRKRHKSRFVIARILVTGTCVVRPFQVTSCIS
jgi:hypothetical protein